MDYNSNCKELQNYNESINQPKHVYKTMGAKHAKELKLPKSPFIQVFAQFLKFDYSVLVVKQWN